MLRSTLLFATLALSTQAFAGGIGIVDFQRAVNETNEGKAAQQKLDGMLSARKAEIAKLESELQASIEDYKKRSMVLSDAARKEAEQAIGMKQQQYQQKAMQFEGEMQQQYMEMLSDLDTKLRATASTIGKEKGYDVVLDAAVVVYAGPGATDITTELVTRYNSK